MTQRCPGRSTRIGHTGQMPTGPDSRAPQTSISRVPYLPGLDGLRALAVMIVMVYHAHQWLPAGFLGVEVFFVISGYLITLLLIAEHERDGRLSLRKFWVRRFRRLLPALYVTLLIVGLYCLLFFQKALGKLRGDAVGAVTYSTNWYQIWSGQGYTSAFDFVPLRHLWSLAVEEQFYLIWPLVMLFILRKGRERLPRTGLILFGIAVAIAIVTAIMFHPGASTECSREIGGLGPPCTFGAFGRQFETNNFLYLGTLTRCGGLLLGSGFAMIWRPMAIMRGPLRKKSGLLDLFGVIGLAIIGLLAYKFELYSSFHATWAPAIFRGGLLLTGFATLMAIAAVTHGRSRLGKFLGNPVLNWIGTRSYGLYLFHWPIYEFIRKQAGIKLSIPEMVLALLLTGSVAETSYRYVETPIRQGHLSDWWRDRRRLGPQRRKRAILVLAGITTAVGVLVVELVGAPIKCTNDIECSLAEAKAVQQTTTVAPSVPDASPTSAPATALPQVTVPGETTLPTVAPTTALPTTTAPTKLDVFAVGDSVMVGAAKKLALAGIWVDAKESRQAPVGADILEYAAANGLLGDNIVIHMGTNGPMSDATLARMMAASANAKTVLVLTIKADVAWAAANNERIRALPATYSNVTVVDWETAALNTPGILYGDGIHLKGAAGTSFYTNLILTALGRPTIP